MNQVYSQNHLIKNESTINNRFIQKLSIDFGLVMFLDCNNPYRKISTFYDHFTDTTVSYSSSIGVFLIKCRLVCGFQGEI